VNLVRFAWITFVQTLFRVFPFPCATGVVKVGDPGRDSPVLLTCNFRLTVERLKRAVAGIDAYLLVANSRGVNVWCAATGGLLTNHDGVSVLKTSGIAALVDHRRLILPQLAATGIEGAVSRERTGWQTVWGPVHARSIPEFLRRGLEATSGMRRVSFAWPQRLEMAVAWAFPISLLGGLVAFPFFREGALALVGLVWGLSASMFLAFPLCERWLRAAGRNVGFVFFDFGRRGVPLLAWLLFTLGLLGYGIGAGELSVDLVLRWGLSSLVVVLVLGLDLMGSTPTYKSGLHEDRLLRIALDDRSCRAAGFCEEVCPTDVFDVDYDRRVARLPGAERCVQCGACIVQCPFDALHFESPSGGVVRPETVRRFKLNLLGRRMAAPRT
jgi:ferredoxin